jgi:hypothetical protein
MVDADSMTIAALPDEASFKARLQRSGTLEDGWLDLAIDLDGESIGRIQTFVPAGRPLPPNVFEVGSGSARTPGGRVTGEKPSPFSPIGCSRMKERNGSRHPPTLPISRCAPSSTAWDGSSSESCTSSAATG